MLASKMILNHTEEQEMFFIEHLEQTTNKPN